jgi:TatD DNase family protein
MDTSYDALKQEHFPSNHEANITISCDKDSIKPVLNLLEEPDVYGAFGFHPHEAKEYNEKWHQHILECMRHPKVVAWGEIGLDYHYDFSPRDLQQRVFVQQLEAAVEQKKPVIIHTREAEEDTLRILKDVLPTDWNIHVHCFTSSLSLAMDLLESFSNLYLGFTGILTFKNAEDIRDVVRHTPITRLLLETDGPYLAPVPHRGKPCHPGWIPYIAQSMADLKQVSLENLYQQVRANTRQMYGI